MGTKKDHSLTTPLTPLNKRPHMRTERERERERVQPVLLIQQLFHCAVRALACVKEHDRVHVYA